MFCNPYSSSFIAGLRVFEVLPLFNVRNPPAPAVNSCKYYDCSYGYERKRGYRRITCKDECDDDQCCDKGGSSLVYNRDVYSLCSNNKQHVISFRFTFRVFALSCHLEQNDAAEAKSSV